jgi:hypothetical protein
VCASWTDTSAALLRSASERFAVFMVEENLETIVEKVQTEANSSQSMQWFAKLGLKREGGPSSTGGRG